MDAIVRTVLGAVLLLLACSIAAVPLFAQDIPFPVNEESRVGGLSFRFETTRTFDAGRLQEQMVTTGPGFMDRVKRILPFMKPAAHPFNVLELQRDVARLRLFYEENGFPKTRIGYASSRFDPERNKIYLVLEIDEGAPMRIRSIVFAGPEGDAPSGATEQDAYNLTLRVGDRYSVFERMQARSQTLAWLKENGYAFAQVRDTVITDLPSSTVEMRLLINRGPLAYFDDIEILGNESLRSSVILRELPFRRGQRFSEGKLKQGQREVFALNLFRTALTSLPAQPRDSTVSVRLNVREAKPQLITYQIGYDRIAGVQLEGNHIHRNFLGSARSLTTSLVMNTGYGAAPGGGRPSARLFRATVALRQPYLFTTRLSGTLAPFLQFERDQQLALSDRTLGINAREFGLTTTLFYELLPFRNISFAHTVSQSLFFTEAVSTTGSSDRFNRNIFTLAGNFGRTDDYLSPTRGFLVRPVLEAAGSMPGLRSGVAYYKAATTLVAYARLTDRTGIAGMVSGGRIWPRGAGRDQADPLIENRFDPIRFYTGGSNELRGWKERLAGPKVVRPDIVNGDTLSFAYEAVGGLAKLAANVELRLPFPGLGEAWGTALFFEAGRLSEGDFALDHFRYDAGAGLRYRIPVGYLRLDLAYKLNPDDQDLRSASDFFYQGAAAPSKSLRRFSFYMSIGQAF